MTPPMITPLKQPIAIRPEYIAQTTCVLRFRGHIFRNEYTITGETNGIPRQLFTVRERLWGGPWTLRENNLGPVLLELSRRGRTWSSQHHVTLPDMLQDAAVVEMDYESSWSGRHKIDVNVLNLAASFGDAELVRLRIEGQGRLNTRFNVYLCDPRAVVMTAKQDVMRFRQEWCAAVAEGFDLSLAAAILMCIMAFYQAQWAPGS